MDYFHQHKITLSERNFLGQGVEEGIANETQVSRFSCDGVLTIHLAKVILSSLSKISFPMCFLFCRERSSFVQCISYSLSDSNGKIQFSVPYGFISCYPLKVNFLHVRGIQTNGGGG